MKLILITSPKSNRQRYEFSSRAIVGLVLCLVLFPVVLGGVSYYAFQSFDNRPLNETIVAQWNQQLESDRLQAANLKEQSERQLSAMTFELAEAQARLIRLEALGSQLIEKGRMKRGEFDFSQSVPLGGLQELVDGEVYQAPQFIDDMSAFVARLDEQEQQLEILDSILDNRLIEDEVFLAGRPIKKGWMSSFYGRRVDPFSGRLAMHKGVDFAGKENAEIIAVASGVVTWSGDRYGFGEMVEIDHGQGYVTRYAHNKVNQVKIGDIVKKGQTIALMGSTGRSTGPHTHFEVLRHGKQVNPERYVYRRDR